MLFPGVYRRVVDEWATIQPRPMIAVNDGAIFRFSVSNLVMACKSRRVQVLRFGSLLVFALAVFPLVLVQVQQRLFRHRAQLLLDDMQNLWTHPGTFDDLRHLQQRWGTFGHYDGTCTAEHCEYTITLTSPDPPRLENDKPRILGSQAFVLLGGREVNILGGIVVRKNQMVLESLWFMVSVPDAVEIRPPFGYAGGDIMEARIRSASRLFATDMFGREGDLERGYEIGRAQPGTNAWVHVTPQTNIADIKRLTDINLDCITRFRPCVDMDHLLPAAWSEFRRENKEADGSAYSTRCSVSPSLFAREADNIALVEIVKLHAPEYPSEERTQGATIRILESLKNNAGHPPGSIADISFGGQNVYSGPGALSNPRRKLATGERLFLLYPRLVPGQSPTLIDTGSCSLIPHRDATLQSVREGIAMDPAGDDLRDISIPY